MKTEIIIQSIAESVLDSRLTKHFGLSPVTVLSRIQVFISGMPWHTQQALKMLLVLFEWSSLWSLHLSGFSKLPLDKRRQYIHQFSTSRIRLKRDIARILKSLCHTACFNLPELWDHLGYAPEAHIRQATMERALRLSAEQAAREKERDRLMTITPHKTANDNTSVASTTVPVAAVWESTWREGVALS